MDVEDLEDMRHEYLAYQDGVEAAWQAECEHLLSLVIAGDAAVAQRRYQTERQWRKDFMKRFCKHASLSVQLTEAIEELRSKQLWPWT